MTDRNGLDPSYEIGRGRPPKHGQFKPGQSGNRKGRPKGSKNFSTAIQTELRRKIAVNEDGRRKKISKREAVAKQLVNNAASGNLKAIPVLLNETRPHEAEAKDQNEQANLAKEDQLVLENVLRRLRASIISTPTPNAPPADPATTDQPVPPPADPKEEQ